MLEKIKSIFFIKIIFSYIEEERKLKIVKYNKAFQNKINIHFINYKIFSGRHIIYEAKGKGKEYDNNNNLVFEGEYLSGEKKEKVKNIMMKVI